MTYGMAPCQESFQYDGSTDTGCETNQRDPQRGFAHGLLQGPSVNQHVMLADLDILPAADHCCMARARQYARQTASAAGAATYIHNLFENRDGWLVAWGLCGSMLIRVSTVWLLPFTVL